MSENILFFILAAVLILVLVGVSILSARREKSRVFSNTFSTRPPATSTQTPPNSDMQNASPSLRENNTVQAVNNIPVFVEEQVQQQIENDVRQIKISLPGQEVEQLQTQAQDNQPFNERESYAYQTSEPSSPINEETSNNMEVPPVNDIVTLYVVAAEGQQFYGEQIQHQLEELGFVFGEYQIFHRHIDSTVSPVLFSVANMLQPGIFDIERMDKFTTPGLVFFMHLPSIGSDVVNVRLMINTVENFAAAINGFVLDQHYQIFTEETRQQYLLNVRQQ